MTVGKFVNETLAGHTRTSCDEVDKWKLGDLEQASQMSMSEKLGEYFDDFVVFSKNTTIAACSIPAVASLKIVTNAEFRRIFNDFLGVTLLQRFRREIGGHATRIACNTALCDRVAEESCSRIVSSDHDSEIQHDISFYWRESKTLT
jgi:hypothetical protein